MKEIKWHKLNKNLALVINFLTDENKKKIRKIFNEILKLLIFQKSFPRHYFARYAYHKEAGTYTDYVDFNTIRLVWNSSKLHSNESIEILKSKLIFKKICQSNGISVAKLYGYNEKSSFYLNDHKIIINDIGDFISNFLKIIFEKFSVENLIAKPTHGRQGNGIVLIKKNDLGDLRNLEKKFILFRKEEYIFEEYIVQHRLISEINPYSVNTLRIDSFLDDNNKVHILYVLMRFGRKGSIVDNATPGGFFIPIDFEKWEIGKFGVRFLEIGNAPVYNHPDTGVSLSGRKIPFGQEIIALIEKVTHAVGDRYCGWDVAISESGPLIIEGNLRHHIGLQDTLYKGYKRHPIFRKIIEKYL